jgi:hypothetical protein
MTKEYDEIFRKIDETNFRPTRKQVRYLLKYCLDQEKVIQDLQNDRDQILGPMQLLQTRILTFNKQVQEYMKRVEQFLKRLK